MLITVGTIKPMKPMKPHQVIALIGNPNCGKTTLFNALTGAEQWVGNWPGVTVARNHGRYRDGGKLMEVVDLPGVYSLSLTASCQSEDERIACEYLLCQEADLIVNVLDGSHLERNLYLTMQLLELEVPMILAVNMLDMAHRDGLQLDLSALALSLGCPVLGLSANKKHGIKELKDTIASAAESLSLPQRLPYQAHLEIPIKQLTPLIKKPHARWLAIRALEGDEAAVAGIAPRAQAVITATIRELAASLPEELDILVADQRFRWIQDLLSRVCVRGAKPTSVTEQIDKVILNKYGAIPIFFMVMYAMFLFAINVGGVFQDFFDIASRTIFVDGLAHCLMNLNVPAWCVAILASGAGKGLNTVMSFIPVIGCMFLFLSFLEGSGYMTRAAFVMDRLMRAVGLPGKAFVPLIVGFGCNVPAIMATRTLHYKRDRILTIMMSPFMSCGARLAIYAVFITAFFPEGGQNILFALYVIGIAVAIGTGFLLRKTLVQGPSSPMVMEMPPYHLPTWNSLFLHTWSRLRNFIVKAGKLIVPLCVLIGTLNAVSVDGQFQANGSQHSLLAAVGKSVTPLFSPLGITEDNWPATVGLTTGVLAKEVVIATLNTLYSQAAALPAEHETFAFSSGMQSALYSIVENARALKAALLHPLLASAKLQTLDQNVYGQMVARFHSKIAAFSYLLFILLYVPCVSAMAAITRELDWRWSVFSAAWTTGVAYIVAVVFYQMATFFAHPMRSLLWVFGCAAVFSLTIIFIQRIAKQYKTFPIEVQFVSVRG